MARRPRSAFLVSPLLKPRCPIQYRSAVCGVNGRPRMCSNAYMNLRQGKKASSDEKRGEGDEDMDLDVVLGHLDNAPVKPSLDMEADETILMIKLRRMLSEEDFKRIFDVKDRRIGEL